MSYVLVLFLFKLPILLILTLYIYVYVNILGWYENFSPEEGHSVLPHCQH
jgi:hypothetical protein